MYYGDKERSKVMIMGELVNRGWKVYGHKEDQSDSMTDYYDPASWDGIAKKNGCVLVIDNNDTHYSGYEVKQYDYSASKSNAANYNKIKKLQTLANDSGATEGEKAAALAGIERLTAKADNNEPTYTVRETYPTFTHGNPGKCSWHIEKDGQILAKGTGVFAVNEYDWEDKTKTAAEQKAEKLEAFINKIEKVLINSNALKAEIVIIGKKVIKPVVKEDNTINIGDLLSFSYHGHFWIVTDIYTVGEQIRVSYELTGSEKRGYNRVNNTKRYYQPLVRLQKEMAEGKIKVYTLQEVTEYQEKTVFKKTARKQQKANFDNAALVGDVAEIEETETHNSSNETTQATFEVNEKLNGIEITFPGKPAQVVIEKLKENGFRWHKVKKLWYAVNTSERLTLAQSICNGQEQPQQTAQTVEEVEHVAECLQEISADVLINNGFRIWETPLTEEQNTLYKEQVKAEIERCKYDVTKAVIDKLKTENGYHILVEALQSFSASTKPHNSKQEIERDQTEFVSKIDKQIDSNQKKLDSLSGDYLTNTWKRANEEASRDNKREALRFDVALLEYLKEKAANNSMTVLDIALVTGSVREDLKNYHKQKYTYKNEIKFPIVESHLPKDGWWSLEVPKKQKRLQKANISNTYQLITAIDEYNSIVSEIEKPVNPITAKIKKLEMEVIFKKIDGYFPTPKTIVQRMVELADIQEGESILEPSAGNGNILDGITAHMNDNSITASIEAIEWNHSLCEILKLKQYNITGNDFTEHEGQHDKIIMNPPFERNQDIEHVQHAYTCLKPGGRIVAIMSPHFTFANDYKSVEFREWLDGSGYYETLPEGSFKESGTAVNTILVVIDKPTEQHNRSTGDSHEYQTAI